MDLQLYGKKALITGSSRGIGEAIAKKLALEKATVVVHGRNREQAQRVVEDIAAHGGHAYMVIGDLSDDQDVSNLVREAVELTGHIDILVNNAGGSGGSTGTWADARAASWVSTYERNVLAAVRVTSRLLPAMREARWGRVINLSSVAASMPPPNAPEYSAAKAAINAMTASMAKAVAAEGITVNAVSPGTIHSGALDTRFRQVAEERGLAHIDAPWDVIERAVLPMFAQVPIGRVGTLDEISNAIAFLASPLAGYITGTNLRIDGGLSPSL